MKLLTIKKISMYLGIGFSLAGAVMLIRYFVQ
jgi:hypothetical protein